jgi:Leucine-rich repeat (LRR) protein
VSFNDLKSIPESLGLCKSLIELAINDNKIENLHWNIGMATGLKTLLMHGNRLCMIPSTFSSNSSLETVSLEWF